MKYAKMYSQVIKKGVSRNIRWRILMLNSNTKAIFQTSQWAIKNAEKEKHSITEQDANMAFYPGDICIINKIPLSTFDLVPYGICGRFEARKTFKSEYTYIHELFDKYEAYEGMRISMIDGRPLDARLLDSIHYHPERLAQFNERLEKLKNAFFVINRMGDQEPPDWQWSKISQRSHMIHGRRELLEKLLTVPLHKQPKWANDLMSYYGYFWHRGYKNRKDPNKIFDNMIRFDKAALFRRLKVIT